MNLKKLLRLPSKVTPIPKALTITLENTACFAVGNYLTFHTYEQGFLAFFLYKIFHVKPPTNHITYRITKIVGKSQLKLEPIDV